MKHWRARLFTAVVWAVLCLSYANAYASPKDGIFNVRSFGAKGDGKHDDTQSFQKALDAAAKDGGEVLVPSIRAGRGYVITHTVRVPTGVALVGSQAGISNDAFPWPPFPLPEKHVTGSKIYARPQPDQYQPKKKQPLFLLDPGCTVRGFWIVYDQQPYPSNDQFQDPKSPYYYKSFDEARQRFVKEHVKPYGPTFYTGGFASNIVIEDIVCDRFTDFYFQVNGGKCFLNRVCAYGYKRAFTFLECGDINRISHAHCHPSAGGEGADPLGERKYDWILGIMGSDPEHVGIQIGRSDGYVFEDIFFFGFHTAIQYGSSKANPLHDPVRDIDCYYDPESKKLNGYNAPYVGFGPWGSITNLNVEACAVGLQFVWPAPMANRISNAWIATGINDTRLFAASSGTGDMKAIARQAPFVVEESYNAANDANMVPILLGNNFAIGSFSDTAHQAAAAAHAGQANGRAFLLNGDITIDLTGVALNYPYSDDLLWARGASAGKSLVRLRGLILSWQPVADKQF